MNKLPAICELGGDTVVVEEKWGEEENETRNISNGGDDKDLVQGICQSKTCDYLRRCTLKVLFELKNGGNSVIFESRWIKRNLQ